MGQPSIETATQYLRSNGSRLGRTDALGVLEAIEACLGCAREDEFQALFVAIRALLPFECALVLAGNLDTGDAVVTDGRNIGFPDAWFEAYLAQLGPERDGVVKRAFAVPCVQCWSDAHVRLDAPNALGLCRDFGLRSGYVAGTGPALDGLGRLVCFGGPAAACDERGAAVVHFLAPHLLLAFSRLRQAKQRQTAEAAVTPREREVLRWLKEGKSSWDISVILDIRERTVNFHVANIMRKLGTCNRVQAVAAALHLRLIDFD